MEKFIRIITCSTDVKKPPPVAPPRESLKKKNSENSYVLGPTGSTVGTIEKSVAPGVPGEQCHDGDDELYMDLSTLSKTNLLPSVAVSTAVTPVPPPRGINRAKKVAQMVPVMDKGPQFSNIPEERKAKLLNSLKNRFKKNKTE